MRSPIEIWRGSRSPLREMQQQMDRLFDEFAAWPAIESTVPGAVHPRCNVSEDANTIYVKFDIPGISKENIKVELNNNILSVTADRKEEKRREDEKQYYAEISSGTYFRSMSLPAPVDEKKVEATFENGVLSLKLPKIEAGKAKQIAIH